MINKEGVTLIFPPLWSPFSIGASVSVLQGVLKRNGINSNILDFNIDFFREILSSDFLKKSYNNAIKYINEEKSTTNSEKYNYIYTCLTRNDKNYKYIIKNIDNKIKVFNDKNNFFKLYKLIEANILLTKSLELASLPYYPLIISNNYSFLTELYEKTSTFDNINYFLENEDFNLFYNFVHKRVKEINDDFIGISVSSFAQFLCALTIAKELKKLDKNKFIAIGGQYITHMQDFILQNKLIFNYVDIFMYGDGENAFLDVVKNYKNKQLLYQTNNIIYFNNEVVKTPQTMVLMNEVPTYCFDGLDFSKYFIPFVVLPIQTSRSCYWGKCIFCNYTHGSVFSQKSVQNVVDEIELNVKKYKVRHFYFTDSCLSPQYFVKLADEIIRRKLKIYYFVAIRVEENFDKILLKKLYKSGFRFTSTGFETTSQKLLDKYQKGIDVKNFEQFIKNIYNTNIYLSSTFIFGFPEEKLEELNLTIDFIFKNKKYFDSIVVNKLMLPKWSIMNKKREDYGIRNEDVLEIKDLHLSFFKSNINDREITKKIQNAQNIVSPSKMALSCSIETNLLYVSKYGKHFFNFLCFLMDCNIKLKRFRRFYGKFFKV